LDEKRKKLIEVQREKKEQQRKTHNKAATGSPAKETNNIARKTQTQ